MAKMGVRVSPCWNYHQRFIFKKEEVQGSLGGSVGYTSNSWFLLSS